MRYNARQANDRFWTGGRRESNQIQVNQLLNVRPSGNPPPTATAAILYNRLGMVPHFNNLQAFEQPENLIRGEDSIP